MVVLARRSVLIGGAVGAGLLVSGCTSGGTPDAAPTTAPPPDPLLAELADEDRLVATYDATIARYPTLAARLSSVRADHVAHAAALRIALGPAAPPTTPPSTPATTSPAATATTATTAPPGDQVVPATVGAALAALRAAERAAVAARGTVALTAPADRARLLAGITASEASHLVVLA